MLSYDQNPPVENAVKIGFGVKQEKLTPWEK